MSRRWDRLEPNGTDATLMEGVQARIADPLWMLARQWQVGELDGEDAASPVRAQFTVDRIHMRQLELAGGGVVDLGATEVPIEALIEAVPPQRRSAEDVESLVALAWSLLADFGIDSPLRRALVRRAYPFRAAEFGPPGHPVPADARRRLRLLEARGFDPFALRGDKARRALRAFTGAGGADRQASADWARALIDRIAARGRALGEHGGAWEAEELRYGATLVTRQGETRMDLKLDDYGGGQLDWYAFDRVAPGTDMTSLPSRMRSRTESALPMPLTYAGQPVQRFWEFEDGAVQFGSISAGPGDLARMITADFAATGGDDMFVLAVPAELGEAVRIRDLTFKDTFGRVHALVPARHADRARAGEGDVPFDLFAMGGPTEGSATVSDWLPILTKTANVMNGRPLEQVTLRRDEEANLAWAIEEAIEGPFGRPLRRRQFCDASEPERVDPGVEGPWPYRVQTAVPPWWIPLIPERTGGAEVHLRRARMSAWEVLPPELTGPFSALMDRTRAVTVAEHAVPASGVRISRHWQVARAYDGRPVLWQSWRRKFGAEEKASGLRFDLIDRGW